MERNRSLKRTIRIKLEHSSQLQLQEYENEIERWEGEGGNPGELNDILSDIKLPIKKGQLFKVLGGKLVSENDGIYYEVDIKLLSFY